jgi:hypothetical protein
MRFSRRAWLRLAGASVLLPLFSREDARASDPKPLRLVLLMQENGTSQLQGKFWPDASGSSAILDPLLSHPRLRARTVVVKGISNSDGGAGNQHDQGWAGLFTGRRTTGVFADPWGAGPSIDQILRPDMAGRVPFPTLNCGVTALDTALLKEHRHSFSYLAEREQVPVEGDPMKLYTRLFAPASDPAEAQRRLVTGKSVLDYAAKDLARMSDRLGKDEREKLDVHSTAIREYEQRLTLLANGEHCAAPIPHMKGIDPKREKSVPTVLPMMIDLVALAIGCDLTRIVTFPIGNAAVTWRYDWIGIGKDSHGEIAHKDDGKTPEITDAIVKIGRFHAEHVARLALALDAMPEGDGTVLDNTLIVWGNELATGQHGLENIPVVMIGRAGGALKATGLVDRGLQPYQRLGCTIMNLMGAHVGGFGDAADCGMIQGLHVAV